MSLVGYLNLLAAVFSGRSPARSDGHTQWPEYRAWRAARDRTSNPLHPQWQGYGGRGIGMWPAWQDSFDAFFSDIGPSPAGMTLDRIDNDGDYVPGNVRWADWTTQARNRRPASRGGLSA